MQLKVQQSWRGFGGAVALLLLTRCDGGPTQAHMPEPEPPAAPAGRPQCEAPVTWEETVEVEPVADTYVEAGVQESYGAARKLVADGATERGAYLRFEVTGLPGPVKRAELRLYAIDPSIDGPALYPVETGWDEASVTWGQTPAVTGPLAADVGPVADESWVTYEVTALVPGDGEYSFGLFTSSRDGVDFASREHQRVEVRPRLAVTVEMTRGDCDDTPPP